MGLVPGRALLEEAESAAPAITASLAGTVLTWDSRAVALFGIPADAAVGQPLHAVLATTDGRIQATVQRTDHHLAVRVTSVDRLRQLAADATQFRNFLESAPDAIVIVDGHGDIQLVNAQTETVFGYDRAELIGQPVEKLVPQRLHDVHVAHRHDYADEPRVRAMGSGLELFGLRKDGSEFPIEISLSPLRLESGLAVSAAIRDVSSRKQLEARLHDANRLKSEFLANMSHELRTPLNAIIGFAELMHRGKAGETTKPQKEYLGDVLTSARHLLQLINDILDLAKVESGKMEFRTRDVDLGQLIGETRDVVRGLAAEKRQRIEVHLDATVGRVRVDAARVKQILYNFLSNAIKFTPERGAITIHVLPNGDDELRLEVRDSGVGIPREQLDKLFVEFQQLDGSTAKRHGGTGLGLALTKRIAEGHGGRVEVTSVVGEGSVFAAILPRSFDGGTDGG